MVDHLITIEFWRTPVNLLQEHSKALFNTLGSPVGGGGFNRSRAFRRAWDIGPRALGQGTSRNVSWELGSRAAWFDRPLGCLLELSWGPFLSVVGSPGEALEVSQGGLEGSRGGLGGLLEASWSS